MAIYFMNGKTFLQKFVNEDPAIVMKTQYAIVSEGIRKGGRYEEQVVSYNSILYPEDRIIAEHRKFDTKEYEEAYREQLMENNPLFATIIKACIEEKFTVVFLCSKKDWKRRYFKIMADYVYETFGYPIYDYKKVKKGEQEEIKFDREKVLKLCNEILRNAKEENEKTKMSSAKGRSELLSKMSKKELRKRVKKLGFDPSDMSRSEMIETIEVFY